MYRNHPFLAVNNIESIFSFCSFLSVGLNTN